MGRRSPGRPPAAGAPRTVVVTIRLTPEEAEAVKAHAEETGADVSTLVREAIAAHLRAVQEESC